MMPASMSIMPTTWRFSSFILWVCGKSPAKVAGYRYKLIAAKLAIDLKVWRYS